LKIPEEPIVNRFAGRRKSVFAEQYDPEEDEEEENNKVIFPKTDEQRTRLCDSVKNILLFRALDPEQVSLSHSPPRSDSLQLFPSASLSDAQQMNEILDAMFEKKVKPEDVIIRQGDDGDNFYVIES
jgi:cAMP-dependent protein kinase regulator